MRCGCRSWNGWPSAVQVWYRRLPNQSECQLRKKLTLNGAAQQAGVCSLSTVRGRPAIGRSVTIKRHSGTGGIHFKDALGHWSNSWRCPITAPKPAALSGGDRPQPIAHPAPAPLTAPCSESDYEKPVQPRRPPLTGSGRRAAPATN
jgi:hypothetical protein